MVDNLAKKCTVLLNVCDDVERIMECDITGHHYRSAQGLDEEECCHICKLRSEFREARNEFEEAFLASCSNKGE